MDQPEVSADTSDNSTGAELDVRAIPKPERHPMIFARFDALAVGDSFVLVNNHDPRHLREEFERDHPGCYEWTYLPTGDRRLFRIRIGRLVATDLPRVLTNTTTLLDGEADQEPRPGLNGPGSGPEPGRVAWRLEVSKRDLDSNIIRLAAREAIDAHDGPDHDVLVHVLSGSGQLDTAVGRIELTAGAVVWLPRRSRRAFAAGPEGLAYLTVHTRRPGLSITSIGS